MLIICTESGFTVTLSEGFWVRVRSLSEVMRALMKSRKLGIPHEQWLVERSAPPSARSFDLEYLKNQIIEKTEIFFSSAIYSEGKSEQIRTGFTNLNVLYQILTHSDTWPGSTLASQAANKIEFCLSELRWPKI